VQLDKLREKIMATYNKAEILDELKSNTQFGIAFNQSGQALRVMTFNEFLSWYADATSCHLSIEDGTEYDKEHDGEVETFSLVERVSGKKVNSVTFHTDEEARNAFYERLERRYNDDNGAGGIWYDNSEAIVRIEDEQDEWQAFFEKEEETEEE
jgi:hypothetical protein